ncbi:MAG: tetratricopeptide repeat protein [Candidatus Coatesbacteria bacterium]|nr:tetratricopeptide repeat protein [Candidatus Coatesbacteria bacterium]
MGRDYSPKQVYNNLGSALAERGFNEEAAEAYREALARDPLYRSALINLASLERQLGNDKAADALRATALRLSASRYD